MLTDVEMPPMSPHSMMGPADLAVSDHGPQPLHSMRIAQAYDVEQLVSQSSLIARQTMESWAQEEKDTASNLKLKLEGYIDVGLIEAFSRNLMKTPIGDR